MLYLVLYFLVPSFFGFTIKQFNKNYVRSLMLIITTSIIGFAIAFSVTDSELSNRILHGFGGGFVSFFACFLVVKDTSLNLSRLQFFILSFMMVATLGVANEIIECVLQYYGNLSFAATIYDTWYDLISNTIGSLIAAVIFVPLIRKL